MGAVASYEFTNVQANHTIERRSPSPPSPSRRARGPAVRSARRAGERELRRQPVVHHHAGCLLPDRRRAGGWSLGGRGRELRVHQRPGESHDRGLLRLTSFTITAPARGPAVRSSPNGRRDVSGANQSFTITPDAGYQIADGLVEESRWARSRATSSPTSRATTRSTPRSSSVAYTITATAGSGGSISPSGPVSVSCGANQSFTIAPDACYQIADVLVDGVSVGAVASYEFTSVQANHTISASFVLGSHTITATAGAGGSISPSGPVSVSCGANQSFTITPDACYQIADVLVDGVSVGAVASTSSPTSRPITRSRPRSSSPPSPSRRAPEAMARSARAGR